MKASLFEFPVEIRKVEWPWKNKASQEDVLSLLDSHYPNSRSFGSKYDFYEVSRPEFGLVRSVITVSPSLPKNEIKHSDYCTIRIFQKPVGEDVEFDLAKHHKNRIEQLITALGSKHYPRTEFLESNKILIVLQPFLFLPVCDFSTSTDILNLIELIYLASKARILLDYNHNHFLRAKYSTLFYVDTDYMGSLCSDEQSALESNLNQSMLFISSNNTPYLPQALTVFSSLSEDHKRFSRLLLRLINEYIIYCQEQKENLSPKLEKKIQDLHLALIGFKI